MRPFLWLVVLNNKTEQLLQQEVSQKQLLQEISQKQLLMENSDAQMAFKKAQEYFETDNIEMAKIYALNAINQAPENIEYLVAYVDLITDSPNMSLDSLQQAYSIIELALYQLPAPEIETAQKLLSEILEHQHRLINELLKVEVTAFLKEDISKEDIPEFEQYITKLQTVLKDIGSNAEEDLINRVHLKLDEATQLYEVARRTLSIEDGLDFLEQETTDLKNVKATVIFQSLSIEVRQLLTLDVPEQMQQRIEDYLTQIEQIEQRMVCTRSEQPYQKFQQVYQKILKIQTLPRAIYYKLYFGLHGKAALKSDPRHRHYYDYKLHAIKTLSTHAQYYAQQVTCSHMNPQIDQGLEHIGNMIRELQKEQYTAYQRWVVEQCYGAFKEYQEEWHVSKGDAGKLLERWKLDSIEQSLLTLEVSQIFNDVVGRILGQLSSPALITDYQKKMATAEKIVLENF